MNRKNAPFGNKAATYRTAIFVHLLPFIFYKASFIQNKTLHLQLGYVKP